MSNKNLITNKQLMLRITLTIISLSIIFILLSSVLVKKVALKDLGEDDALKTSELIFEIMNTRMQEGWSKKDLNKIIFKLEHIREGLKIKSYRSEHVAEMFGIPNEDKKMIENDSFIQKAMKGNKEFMILNDGSIRYLYPILVKQECLSCHTNSKIGDVNGVLDISYPPSEIKISLDSLSKYFVVFFVLTLFIIIYIFYILINIKIVKPIVLLSNNIKDVTNSEDFNKEISVNTNIKEIKLLENNFNKVLEKINMYYKKLFNNIYLDSLTSLGNSIKLKEDLNKKENNSLVIIDINDFNDMCNFYGKDLCNKIIIDLLKILENKIKDIGFLYKLRNNEFGILLDKDINNKFCEELVSFVDNYDFRYEDIKVKINITLAIAYNIDKLIIEKTSATVRLAIAEAKSFKVYKESFYDDDQFSKHIEWTKNLEDALSNNKIIPFFQAIKDVNTSKIDKYEVLARLEKDGVIYTPDKFLNVARRSRQYSKFTIMMIKNSFEFFSKKEGISFSINFSIEDMIDDNVTSYLFEQIEKYDIGHRFIVEILETEEIEDFNIVNDFVKELKKYDVKVAIDDFGSGFSNFTYISKLNIDFLKIDGSLVEDIHINKSSYKVVKNLNSFAHDMGLQTIAEKVHCKEIEDLLYELKVDYVQGYHIGKPQKDLLE